ncbi:hypothetical protein HRM2_26470 [Desulforapulum autotrophicum HRM2]|uniref:Uncharacterized protein n=1 Tax=Desulforapulum autotrophicum (strain ATCC 43914 / DSM 3382 / VKM B-1955 / HRM2) TaxID=177437 RepID=C0QI05_DESAH|nr:hypothetical protein HRM2_26470 [Desulforapulum autotrophicum HRM2]
MSHTGRWYSILKSSSYPSILIIIQPENTRLVHDAFRSSDLKAHWIPGNWKLRKGVPFEKTVVV